MLETDIVKMLCSWNEKTKNFTKSLYRNQTEIERLWDDVVINRDESKSQLLLEELKKFGINEINPNLMRELLYDAYQNLLNAITPEGIGNTVIINGEIIKVDKRKTKVSPYEAILPMIYKTTFGLREGDTIGEIE